MEKYERFIIFQWISNMTPLELAHQVNSTPLQFKKQKPLVSAALIAGAEAKANN